MEKLIHQMKVVLGTSFCLYVKFHAAHWNVEGINFPELHAFFGTIYQDIWESIDDTAEKIRQLDAYTPCSLERFSELSRIKGSNDVLPPAETILMLLKDNDVLIEALKEACRLAEAADMAGLANYLASRLEMHSKWRWQLRATAKRIG